MFVLLLSSASLSAQVTTEGTDFWFGFMDNDNAENIEVYISSSRLANVVVRAPRANFNEELTVAPNTTVRVDMPLRLMPRDEGLTEFGIHVSSDADISVYTLNKRQFSADATVILPTSALGEQYYAMAHMEPPGDIISGSLESELLIVAPQNNTEIEITPSVNTFGGLEAGVPQIINLSAGETYQIKSNEDLSGTFVRTIASNDICRKVAVFGGNKFTNVGGCGGARDHLIEQMFPLASWGRRFLYVPYETRLGGDYLKIIAAEDDTRIDISGQANFVLNKGEMYVDKALENVRTIQADKPIQIAQLSRSTSCDGVDGDPFMIMLSPLEQRIAQVTFDAFDAPEIEQYYLTLITTADNVSGIILDGVDVSGQFQKYRGEAYANIEISQGTHTITAPNGVITYVYGYGFTESFGYSAGVGLSDLRFEILLNDLQIGLLDKEGCIDSEMEVEARFLVSEGEDPLFNVFDWDFGDGTRISGERVSHTYTRAGTYQITLVASNDEVNDCSSERRITRFITVGGVEDDITGPPSVCPNVEGVEYSVEGVSVTSYEWSVIGGTIVGDDTGTSIMVDWGDANPNASVTVLATSNVGCVDEVVMNVKVDELLEPVIPEGSTQVCRDAIVTYEVPAATGSEFEWFVNNGIILDGNSTPRIDVQWGTSGVGEVWYREYNPSVTSCEGVSEVIEVEIFSELTFEQTVSNVSCQGNADGRIALDVQIGVGPYTFSWDHGANGQVLDGLAPGTYTVTIEDASGCSSRASIAIEEPPVMEATAESQNVSCFGGSDGSASVQVSGGVAPYRYYWNGAVTPTSAANNTLRAGVNTVRVLDANNCELIVNIQMEQPQPLSILSFDVPTCSGEDTGRLSIEARGGTPPYTYLWNTDQRQTTPSIDGLSAGSYSVTVTDSNGCTTTFSDERIFEKAPRILMPNAFSPNGDGMNDTFVGVADCSSSFEMFVYSKWGEVMFYSNDVSKGWDGTFKGTDVPTGSYTYMVKYSAEVNGFPFDEIVRGTVRIIR